MISLEAAKKIVSGYLDSGRNDDYSLILIEDLIREEEFGWVFFL
ncbi:hypothetical protein [Chryseolinea serpens]|nr:hypothetical protein [Chryseolinea serpens]